ncbi:histidinol-phosphatase HisJ [Helicobacter himalayensis]|uniref:histidinol-phosphatase HisJ n=1 Tax=Helicobacter himalayensis TaxID=1591088 RepID=UPI0008354B62|nr:histidinol-phosphatase HisJ [Helicobacter himalayensis]
MRLDMHNHTPLCNHASGAPREYLQRAVELGIDIYGFTCHAPMEFDKEYRMRLEDVETYIADMCALREEFRDKIDVRIGLEVDFIKGREDLLESSILRAPLDYLIGSVHFLGSFGFDNPAFLGHYKNLSLEKCWEEYLDSITLCAQSGNFEVIGHFDLLKVFNNPPPKSVLQKLTSTLESIKQAQCVMEINASGLRKPCKEQYPSKEILSLAFEIGVPITFSSDAHAIEHIGFRYEHCRALAKEVGYTHIFAFKDKIPQEYVID